MIKYRIEQKDDFLTPYYVKEADLLDVRKDNSREWTYGIDINGTIIFDIGESFYIENIELLIPKKLWKKSNTPFKIPENKIKTKSIKISEESIESKSFYSKTGVIAVRDSNYLLYIFNPKFSIKNMNKYEAIKICEKSYIVGNDNEMYGLLFCLSKIIGR